MNPQAPSRPARSLSRISLLPILLAVAVLLLSLPSAASGEDLPPHKLELQAALSHGQVLIGEPQEVYGVIDLEALAVETEKRVPINLALVIDRSGSMSGPRIVQARQAALNVVDALADGDRLALITYGSNHTVEFDSTVVDDANREKMRRVIRGLTTSGMTNLSAGYQEGIEIVKRNHDPGSVNRVLLLSDGHANRGVSDPQALQAMSRLAFDQGVATTTIGFGLDYNEQLMTGMAVEGSGNYHFVDDSDDLGAMVAAEMSGLSSTVANRIEVLLDPGPGVEIAEVLGFTHRFRDGVAVIPMAELGSGQARSVVVRLNITTHQGEAFDALTVRANYRDAINDRHRFRRQVLRTSVTEVADEVNRHVDRDILTRVEEVRLAQAMDEAMRAYAAGDQQGARNYLDQESQRSQRVQRTHNLHSDRLDDMGASFRRASETVQRAPAASQEGRRMRMEESEESFQIQMMR